MGWRAGTGAVLRSVLLLTPLTVWLALAALLTALLSVRLLKA